MKSKIERLAEAAQIQPSLIYRNVYRLLDDFEIYVENLEKKKKLEILTNVENIEKKETLEIQIQ